MFGDDGTGLCADRTALTAPSRNGIMKEIATERANGVLKKLRYLDYYLLGPYVLLCTIGIVMVYSASAYYIKSRFGYPETAMVIRQAMWVAVGFAVTMFFFYFKIAVLRRRRVQEGLWIFTLGSLLLLMVLGKLGKANAVNGATAWLQLGPINFQPSEIAKVVVILYLAFMFTARQDMMREPDFSLKDPVAWRPLGLVGFCIALVAVQPDAGGALILGGITVTMLAASGISMRYGVPWLLVGSGIIGLSYYGLSKVSFPDSLLKSSYQLRRIAAALHPFELARGDGGQVVNSLLAIDHGGLFGVGLGMSTQKLGYLPEPYTDFILAVIAEELGLLGATLVIGLLFFLIMRCYLIGIRSKNTAHALIAYGIATMMLIQTVFNVGAVAGMIPVTGVTLPFISYGGSSILVLAVCMGIMLNISAGEKKLLKKRQAAARVQQPTPKPTSVRSVVAPNRRATAGQAGMRQPVRK